MKFIKVPMNRWIIAALVGIGIIFGNDAVVAVLTPLINMIGMNLPAA